MFTCWVSLFCNGFTLWANGTGYTSMSDYQGLFENFENWQASEYIPVLISFGQLSLILRTAQQRWSTGLRWVVNDCWIIHRESALRTAGFFYWLPRWSDKRYKSRLTTISTWMEWTSIIYVPLLSLAAIVDGNEWCFRTSFVFLWGIGSDRFKDLHSLWERIIGSLQVTLVGMAREKEASATDVSFQLDYSTGQIEVKRWSLLFPLLASWPLWSRLTM
jgi:hypothetical protein